MNHDNPYAAPQTLDRAQPWAETLPQAVDSGRRQYADVDTARLTRLANWSLAIQVMTTVWVAVLAVAALMMLTLPMLFVGMLAALRVWGGTKRTPWFWAYDLILDTIFGGSLLIWIFSLTKTDLITLLLIGVPASLFAILAGFSVAAHLLASSLYLHYTHREIVRELRYRKQHGIA